MNRIRFYKPKHLGPSSQFSHFQQPATFQLTKKPRFWIPPSQKLHECVQKAKPPSNSCLCFLPQMHQEKRGGGRYHEVNKVSAGLRPQLQPIMEVKRCRHVVFCSSSLFSGFLHLSPCLLRPSPPLSPSQTITRLMGHHEICHLRSLAKTQRCLFSPRHQTI